MNNFLHTYKQTKSIQTMATICLLILSSMVFAQEKTGTLINYCPNSNFVVVKVKNAKELKAGLENHPLKKLIYNDKTKDRFDDIFKVNKKDDEADESKEEKESSKKTFDKLFSSFNGEIMLCVSFEKMEEAQFEKGADVVGAFIAQVDQELFQEFIKMDVANHEKSKTKNTITKKQHEGIEYFSIISENAKDNSFSAVINGLGVLSSDEEVFKKILTAIVKKSAYENGLKSNESLYRFLNSNLSKDVLVSMDFSMIFKNQISKEPEGMRKLMLNSLKLDKLFQLNATFDIDEKVDSFELAFNCLDDGILQFFTFNNNEFVPSGFISADVSSYTRAFFSISDLKKKIIEFMGKINPQFVELYNRYLAGMKVELQMDPDALFDSIGDDTECFTALLKDGTEEKLFVNKLKNQSDFTTNLANLLNHPGFKQGMEATLSLVENKEGENRYWAFTSKTSDPKVKATSFALGSTDNMAFVSFPNSNAQKHIALVKKSSDSKLSGSATYNATRALYPSKVAFFRFDMTKDLILFLKAGLANQQATISKINPNIEKITSILDDIKAEDFKGNISFGLWKETNKISLAVKLTNK